MVDTSNLENMIDPKKKDYLKNFIISESIRQISSKLKINSNGKLGPLLEEDLNNCIEDNNINIPNTYFSNNEYDTDFILFSSSYNSDDSSLAYAYSCILGKEID